jgi:hypothetical protein
MQQARLFTGSAVPGPSYFLAQIDGKKADTMTTDNTGWMCTTLVEIFSPCRTCQLVVAHTRCTLLSREDAPRPSLACTPNPSTTTHLVLFS